MIKKDLMKPKKIIWPFAFLLFFMVSKAQATSQFDTDKLSTLCKVWGFLKYYHPNITENDINWDSVLIVSIPAAMASENKKEFQDVLETLFTKVGTMKKCIACPNLSNDSLEYQVDFKWFTHNNLLGPQFSKKLEFISRNAIVTSNKYIRISSIGVPYFEENHYKEMQFPSTEYRLLALFRYWNIINYFYPYKKLIEEPWDSVLATFIPKMIKAKNAVEYNWKLLELTSTIEDGHNAVGVKFNPPNFKPRFGVKDIDGVTFVIETDSGAFVKKGDIILEKSGVEIKSIRDSLSRFFRESNDIATQAKIDGFLLFSDSKETQLKIKRGDSIFYKEVEYKPFTHARARNHSGISGNGQWKIIKNNIGYVDVSQLEPTNLDSLFNTLKDCKAIIFDVRARPKAGLVKEVPKYINKKRKPMAKFEFINFMQPGSFYSPAFEEVGPDEELESFYSGKIIILVNENTASMGEYFVMGLQTSESSYTIGRKTAGADGNIAFIWFPGSIRTSISSIGIYYPDNTQTQKTGIKIDQKVPASIEEVLANRDYILTKSIEYAETK